MTRDRSAGAGQHLRHSGKSLLVHSRGRAAKSRTDMTEITPVNFTGLPAGSLGRSNGGILNPGSRYKKSRFHSQSHAILIKPPAADLNGFESEIHSNKRQSAKADCLLLVEMVGFEPMTSRMRTERSPN